MGVHLAFLRAINLGPRRVFPKDDIRRVVSELGFDGVETHINTGNVRFDTRLRSRAKIEGLLETAFARDRGFEVPAIVYGAAEFAALARDTAAIADENPGLARHYVYLLKEPLDEQQTALVEARADERGRMLVRGRAAHALLQPGYQNGSVDPLAAASLLGVGTNRNASVVRAVAAKWC
ncbi:DUF1697 domain-containing protein [Microbacterium sp. 179-B 1A2 NHS]|uniref:DUF1697 domain-containing protein n=1 Tax=Microbacterium sp. 179-B 1A2 NHS TaxID=3142383 RepID=UPI0039A0713C